MSYAGNIRVLPNSVKAMFGLVSMHGIMQALREAREDANKQRIADLTSGPYRDEVISLAKKAGQAARPVAGRKIVRGPTADNV